MKKTLCIAGISVLLVVIISSCVIIAIHNSPEYALVKMVRDVKEYGLEGLEPHLTGEAQVAWNKIDTISDNTLLNSFLSIFDVDYYMSILKTEIAEIEWDIGEILKNNGKANIDINFNYKEKIIGAVELILIREEGGWKISNIGIPSFEKIEW